jgi:hypothetical protein
MDPAAARTCYEELQALAYQNAVGVYAVQPLERVYLRTEVRGYYYRPGIGYPDYYALSKGLPPNQQVLNDGEAATATFPHATGGTTTTLTVPSDALTESVTLVHTPDSVVHVPSVNGLPTSDVSFDLNACIGGECLSAYTFAVPVTLTLSYASGDVAGLLADTLVLYTWNGSAWVEVVDDCGWDTSVYKRPPGQVVVPICHLSPFVLAGEYGIYLPLVTR